MLVLAGIAVIAGGFLLRFNPLLVIVASAAVTGWAAGLDPLRILATFGHAFNETRYVTAIYMVLPVIGLLERRGLQERARGLVAGLRGATAGRLLAGYLLFRQVTAALGLTSVAGPAQTVRPLVAPMAQAAAERQGATDDAATERVKAMAAATDNIGLFFGEDIFIAIGSILLMKGVLDGYGIVLEPFQLSVWAIPTAIAAFAIHGARLMWLDRRLARKGPAA
ncbi:MULTISPECIES: DUF969 domain-containing protein [Sphingomonas]|jgi:uncharacterized membrane protein|uniref:DUF969 domain-containing protein n=1 Tax=Sphingomonas TaxID=13687 RepID=UPI0008372163|nr:MULTISPECIES: DUF969 domain-containing protein [Sphingomonas]MBY0300464.1 DUF969 domain-containing protein [Sphingomonas ginsenosidimutans]